MEQRSNIQNIIIFVHISLSRFWRWDSSVGKSARFITRWLYDWKVVGLNPTEANPTSHPCKRGGYMGITYVRRRGATKSLLAIAYIISRKWLGGANTLGTLHRNVLSRKRALEYAIDYLIINISRTYRGFHQNRKNISTENGTVCSFFRLSFVFAIFYVEWQKRVLVLMLVVT